MSVEDTIHIFAIDEILKVGLIDGGDTLAVQLRDTAGDEVAFLIAVSLAGDMSERVQAALRDAAARPRWHWADAGTEVAGPRPCTTLVDSRAAGFLPDLAGA